MRKLIAVLVVSLFASIALAGYVWKGAGVQVTAATTPATYTIPGTNYCYAVSIHNTGNETVYVTKATSTNGFVAATSIPIGAGMTYSAAGSDMNNEAKGRQITAITYATTNGTSAINIAFE
jgi:hypothetical protein